MNERSLTIDIRKDQRNDNVYGLTQYNIIIHTKYLPNKFKLKLNFMYQHKSQTLPGIFQNIFFKKRLKISNKKIKTKSQNTFPYLIEHRTYGKTF